MLFRSTSTPRRLTKSYTFGSKTYVRDILLPIASTIVITANATPIAVTVGADGKVAPTSPWPSGQVIKAERFEFDVRVRFGADFIPFRRAARPVAEATVELVEAFAP